MTGIETSSKVVSATQSAIVQAEINGVQSVTLFAPSTNHSPVTVICGQPNEPSVMLVGAGETQVLPTQRTLADIKASGYASDVIAWFAPWDNSGLNQD